MKKHIRLFALTTGCFFFVFSFSNCLSVGASKGDFDYINNKKTGKSSVDVVMNTYDRSLPDKDSFFSLLSRLRYVKRWHICDYHEQENLEEHSFEVAMIAHAITTIKNIKFGANLNAERAAVLGMFHDVTEIVTGDMPTPTKYSDAKLRESFTNFEEKVSKDMLDLISDDEIRKNYESLLSHTEEEQELWKIVKYADTISLAIKCLRERKLGNNDLEKVLITTKERISEINDPAVEYFVKNYLPSYGYNL